MDGAMQLVVFTRVGGGQVVGYALTPRGETGARENYRKTSQRLHCSASVGEGIHPGGKLAGARSAGQQAYMELEPPQVVADIQKLVADAMWQAGQFDKAVEVYDAC